MFDEIHGSTTADIERGKQQMAIHVNIIAWFMVVVGAIFVLELFALRQGSFFGLGSLLFLALVALANLVGGVALLKRKSIGRILAIVLSIVMIPCPISWYALWVMTRGGTKDLVG